MFSQHRFRLQIVMESDKGGIFFFIYLSLKILGKTFNIWVLK